MPIRISMSGPDADEELAPCIGDWVMSLDTSAGWALYRGGPARPSEVGAALDVIQFVVDHGFQPRTWR